MNQTIEEQIRALAQPLWESAARPYGMAIDFWLMAEQMVVEMMATTSRLQKTILTEAPPIRGESPGAAPIAHIRGLAQAMWEAAGRHCEMTQEFWLAAERHVLAMQHGWRSESSQADGQTRLQELCKLPPAAYLERIRLTAYYMWESAGQQYGRAFDFWLAAERQTLAMMKAACPGATKNDEADGNVAPVDDSGIAATAEPSPPEASPAAAMPAASASAPSPAAPSPAEPTSAEPSPAEPTPAELTAVEPTPAELTPAEFTSGEPTPTHDVTIEAAPEPIIATEPVAPPVVPSVAPPADATEPVAATDSAAAAAKVTESPESEKESTAMDVARAAADASPPPAAAAKPRKPRAMAAQPTQRVKRAKSVTKKHPEKE